MKHPLDMTGTEYKRMASAMDRHFGAKPSRKPRPRKPRLGVCSFKISIEDWRDLKREAKRRGITAGALIRTLAKGVRRVIITA